MKPKNKKLHVELKITAKEFSVDKFREIITKEKLTLISYKQQEDYIFVVLEIPHKEN